MNASRYALLTALLAAMLNISVAAAQDTTDTQKKRMTAKVVDGKVIIVDSDGNTRTIDLAEGDAKSILLEEKMEIQGGDEKRSARAIIVGPDGKTQEVELEGLPKAGVLRLPGLTGQLRLSDEGLLLGGDGEGRLSLGGLAGIEDLGLALGGQKFMIGVSCSELEGALKAHLDLEHGLVVEQVVEDSPSDSAGIKQYDVIVRIDGDAVTGLSQLVEAVQAAGEDERALRISLLRGRDDLSLEVTPEKRKAASLSFDFTGENEGEIREKLKGFLDERGMPALGELRFERFGPGLIQGATGDSKLQNEIEDLKKQIKELKETLRQLRDGDRSPPPLA